MNAHWGPTAARKPMSEAYWKQPLKWNAEAAKEGVRRKVFCASLADVFEGEETCQNRDAYQVIMAARARLFPLIEATPWLDWLLLTKRPQNVMYMVPPAWLGRFPENVWLGTSVEDQKAADERIPELLLAPAPVRFLSCEPLLGEVVLRKEWLFNGFTPGMTVNGTPLRGSFGVHWVIVGGESGTNARPCPLFAVRDLVEQCKGAGVPVFVKQLGANPTWCDSVADMRYCNGEGSRDRHLRDPKGGDIAEFPADLRVREFPVVPERSAP